MTKHSANFLHLTSTAWVASNGSTNNHDSPSVMPSYQSRTGRGESLHRTRGQEDCSPLPVWAGTERTSHKAIDNTVEASNLLESTCCRVGAHYSTALSDWKVAGLTLPIFEELIALSLI